MEPLIFGYSNSPAEFNIFLHKAMSDTAARGNLIYVDDILMRSRTFDIHLTEIRHVLSQLPAAGAKLAIAKGQWGRAKVEYVDLTVGADGIVPQSGRIRAIRDIKPPTVEIKFSDCEKVLFATVWAVEHFCSYIGGQKVIIETCHHPVTFFNSQRLREGRVSNSCIASLMMALQGYDVEVKYAQNHKMALSQGLAECQHCDCERQPSPQSLVVTTPSFPSNHLYHDENACLDLTRFYVDSCSYHHERQIRAGAGIVLVNRSVEKPNNYWQGNKTNNGMRNAGNKEVKNSQLFLACNRLVTDQGMTVYWKKVKGHSQTSGPDKNGNDKADRLAKLGAEQVFVYCCLTQSDLVSVAPLSWLNSEHHLLIGNSETRQRVPS
ncbi:hypothetical protein F2P81_010891 [Scophthalmus maximus]|uniref:Uncharacterized protein n=1 Tax=Scophthalmus maximus TaxID=52904 RepID=A0A6A4SWU3_SCOMX|nr:hypothetical protein F2P81_010891 [Scophthalmus maximus]